MDYPLIFREEDGDTVIRSRHFPELLTFSDATNSLAIAEDALDVVVLTYLEKGLDLPESSEPGEDEVSVYVPISTAMKALVIQAFKEAGISKVELANRMGVAETEARRILDPHYGTKPDKIEGAAKAMGKRLIVELAA